MERATSDNAVLDALLQAAYALHPVEIDLSLGRLERLLSRLGNPQNKLPPVFHVAGTNGKGIDRRLPARLSGGVGAPRACLYLAAPHPLQRAHPRRRPGDQR